MKNRTVCSISAWAAVGISLGLIPFFSGCSGQSVSDFSTGSSSGTAHLATGGASKVYVAQLTASGSGAGVVAQYVADASNQSAPAASFTTQTSTANSYTALDVAGQLYAGVQSGSPEVLVFASGSRGTASAVRTIQGGAASFATAGPLATDSVGQLYVADPAGSISVFAANASGAATPLRRIQGDLTRLSATGVTSSLAVDSQTGTLRLVMDPTSATNPAWTILEFTSSATGNLAPSRVVTVSNLCSLNNASHSSLDANGNFYVACVQGSESVLLVYSLASQNVTAPSRTISGTATGLGSVLSVTADKVGNLYVLNYSQSAGLSVKVFGPTGSGDVAPGVQFPASSMTSIFPQISVY